MDHREEDYRAIEEALRLSARDTIWHNAALSALERLRAGEPSLAAENNAREQPGGKLNAPIFSGTSEAPRGDNEAGDLSDLRQYLGAAKEEAVPLSTPCTCEGMRKRVIAEYIDDHGITCDCCQHVMIDVTAAKDGTEQHCIAGDPEGEGSGCASSFHGEVVPKLQAECDRLRAENATLHTERTQLHDIIIGMEPDRPDVTDDGTLVGVAKAISAEMSRLQAENARLQAYIKAHSTAELTQWLLTHGVDASKSLTEAVKGLVERLRDENAELRKERHS